MGILAVAQILGRGELDGVGVREEVLHTAVGAELAQVIGNGPVVAGRQLEGLDGQPEIRRLGDLSARFLHFFQDGAIICRVGDDADKGIILGRRPEHGRSADIDVFDGRLQGAAFFRHGFFKLIEVDDDHVDEVDPMFPQGIACAPHDCAAPAVRREFSDAAS